MKKFFMLLCGLIVSLQIASAQAVVVGSENFDGSTHTFTSTPGTAWTTSYNPYSLAVSGTKSIWSEVPFGTGDSVILTSPVYDCSNYAYVSLRFSHICKVSPMDEVRVEFKLNNVGAQWQKLPVNSYKGGAANYGTSGFNAESYSIWNASDSLAMPANSWWKEEMFDLSNDVSYSGVQFRFIIKKGNVSGTQISHGWVIDNFELSASMYEIKPPVVEFLTHYADTVGFTGPYTIKAKVVARTAIPVVHPVLNYTATHAIAGTHTDSVLMTPVEGDSIWEAVIPQHIFGTTYTYFIYGHDTVGNYTLARSGFISAHIAGSGGGMYKYVGDTTNTTTTNYAPYYTWFDYSWSKMLYTSADLPNGTNSISEIAFKAYSLSNTTGVNNQEVYMKVVTDASITNTNYVDPITDGATLVWTGNLPGNIPADTWVNIQLNTPFLVPGGNGVLIYWYNKDGSYEGSTCEWYANTSNNTLAVYNYSDGSMPTGGGSTTNRPIMRIMAGGVINDSNSVGIEDYAMGDSVATSPSTQVPVKLVLRNKGYANLTKATINWTVNGVAQTPYTWTGNIPDDYMDTTIIGTYHPRVNMLDTIVAWTSMPNNVIDTNTFDDTLVKIIYGSSDIVFTWIDAPGDTVYSTGPYLMKLHARTLSGANIDALNMTYTYPDTNNTPVSVTVPMTFQGKNMWHAVIPNIRFENPVTYSVTKTDTLGNVVNTNGHYYIKFIGLGKGVVITDSVNYYDANDFGSGDCSFPWTTTGDGTNWSRSIYPSSALGNTNKAINFAGIAYHTENMPSVPHFRYNVLCYAKPTTETYIQTSGSYVDPIAAGATLLFKGDITGITYGWNKVEFDQILTIPQGQNLMIWWIDTSSLNSCSQNTTTLYWDQWWDWSDPMTDRVSYNFSSGCGGSSANYEEWALPFSIFYTGYRRNSDTNSVALAEIVSPSGEGITSGTHPIQAMIRNMGMADLTSCNITYTINNGTPVSYAWTGLLPSDFVDTVTLGTYTAIAGKIDNITMWVDTPNHVYDSTSYDDTLSVDIVVCNGPLDGSYTLGDTNIADFNNMPQFIKTLEKCGI
ncbi:MAG: hypothetical protein J6Y47_01140, partial [Bacteroidales bacterium]|nr:hypothetical protein [Bacteroidales bacterium]